MKGGAHLLHPRGYFFSKILLTIVFIFAGGTTLLIVYGKVVTSLKENE